MPNKILFFISLLLLYSCQNSVEESTEITPKTPVNQEVKKIEQLVKQINADEKGFTVANSLSYQHNDGSAEEVFAFLNEKQEIVKIEEKFKNGDSGDSGVRFFYLEKGKLIMSEERFIDAEKSNGKFIERMSFYDKKGKPFQTNQRLTAFEEDLEKLEFKAALPYNCSMQTAENVLNQKGKFSTTFQGFASDGPVDYLIVGGPGKTGYASALAVQYADSQIQFLRANEVKNIDAQLKVEFEKMMDDRKLEFQILTRLEIVK